MLETQEVKLPTIEEWCGALRSDEYSQTSGRLRDEKGFCCIGVYGDLIVKKGLGYWKDFEGYPQVMMPSKYDCLYQSFSEILPELGLTITNGDLIDANDRDRKTFKEIADIVEANKLKNFPK